jgi:hypothetical protein
MQAVKRAFLVPEREKYVFCSMFFLLSLLDVSLSLLSIYCCLPACPDTT